MGRNMRVTLKKVFCWACAVTLQWSRRATPTGWAPSPRTPPPPRRCFTVQVGRCGRALECLGWNYRGLNSANETPRTQPLLGPWTWRGRGEQGRRPGCCGNSSSGWPQLASGAAITSQPWIHLMENGPMPPPALWRCDQPRASAPGTTETQGLSVCFPPPLFPIEAGKLKPAALPIGSLTWH